MSYTENPSTGSKIKSFFKNAWVKGTLIFLLVAGLLFGGICWGIDWHTDNRDADLRAEYSGQDDVCKSYFKTMWGIIQDKAKVVNKSAEDFREIYIPLMEGRYGGEGEPLFEWIKEDNPDYSLELHKDLMVTIEATRTQFHEEQKKKISIKVEHDKLRTQKPWKWFLNDTTEISPHIIITDEYTESTWETGHDERELEL